jgi:hypothetical protein
MEIDDRIKKLEEEVDAHQKELQMVNLRQQELVQLIVSKRGGITELSLLKEQK